MDQQGADLPPAERAVRAPADAVEAATSPLTGEPRRQRMAGELVVAGLAGAVIAIVRRLRR